MNQHEMSERPSSQQSLSPRRALWAVVVLLCVAVIVAISGIVPRLRARTVLRDQTIALAAPTVLIAPPMPGYPQQEVQLPGSLSAYTDASINARTSGYLQKWYFDIGAHVKKGQLLAVLSTPELDQQLQQAQGELAVAQANATVAQANATRYRDLLKTNSVSVQDTENFESQAKATSSTVSSLQANVRRLKELQSFERIYAPFDGVITARNVDVGELVDAGAGKELFHLSAVETLRVYVNVPQVYSLSMKPQLPAELTLIEYPNRKFAAHLVRTSNAIDPSSRTLLVEFDVENRKRELMPGAFAQVRFRVKPDGPSVIIPVSALIFRSEGLRVAVVGDGDRVHLVPITMGEDDGKFVQIIGGLDSNARVVQDPPDSLVEGEKVNVVERPKSQEAAPSAAGEKK
ncbi:MAG TPA: efflux RND transporter periplasmic adaptor subunit [Acidisarcina sp.]|nr:efflux RND transporter periplasmic adaptor subunit [Acidisarcina sp.]